MAIRQFLPPDTSREMAAVTRVDLSIKGTTRYGGSVHQGCIPAGKVGFVTVTFRTVRAQRPGDDVTRRGLRLRPLDGGFDNVARR
ncbi:hypothetical protein HSR121_2520 [Halapricum desulfuricans]|uniref:Uncharacterized protein n=1 Tax=Halapricum desulfuricans TaxID=2841257 RepID=A0A897N2X8_9EURY|nr:hypothetical protein HSR121_2520 [Halapricum desulfuricans]